MAQDLRRLYALGGVATARINTADKLGDDILSFRQYGDGKHPVGVGLGTDTGGFNAQPGPTPDPKQGPFSYPFQAYHCGLVFGKQQTGERTFDINKDGVAHYGLVPDLLADVERRPHGHEALGLLFHSAEAYLETWQRAVSAGT